LQIAHSLRTSLRGDDSRTILGHQTSFIGRLMIMFRNRND
jgi:hypothetical protein